MYKKGRKLVKKADEVRAHIYGVSHYPLHCSYDDPHDSRMDAGLSFIWIIKVWFAVDDIEIVLSMISSWMKDSTWNGLVKGRRL